MCVHRGSSLFAGESTSNACANRQRIDAFNDALAEQVEGQIGALVASGAKEDSVRKLVRDAINLGRSAS